MNVIEELKLDVCEVETLMKQATRPKVRDALSLLLRKIQTDISDRQEQLAASEAVSSADATSPSTATVKAKAVKPRCVQQLTTYAWDQSDKFMKIYATLDNITLNDAHRVTCEYTNRSFKMIVTDLNDRDYCLHVGCLSEDINPTESYHKVKKNQVLVMLKKVTQGKTWPYVVEKDKKQNKPPPKMDETKDPSDSLMDLLKKMHDEGDDEMKRSIQKAWHDSRNKQ